MYKTWKPEELVVKPIEYFWQGVIPYGFPTFINGSTGLGKTNVMIKVAADATRGLFPPAVKEGYLAKPAKGDPIRVFYVSTENPVCEVVYPAFLHNGADRKMFRIQKEETDSHFLLTTEDLEAVMDDFSPRLIIVDAFQEHLPHGTNLSDGEAMSRVIKEWESFAYRNKVALVLIGNDAKGSEGRSDANKMLGSGVITRKTRVLVTVKEEYNERYLQITKMFGFTRKEDIKIGYRFGGNNHLEFYQYRRNALTPVEFLEETVTIDGIDSKRLFAQAADHGITDNQLYKARGKTNIQIRKNADNTTTWHKDY